MGGRASTALLIAMVTSSTRCSANIAQWNVVHDAPMGPKEPRSTVLTREQESTCAAFRKHTLLSLDECLLRSN